MRRTWPRRCPQCPGGAPVAAVLLQHLGAASGDVRAVLGLAKFSHPLGMPSLSLSRSPEGFWVPHP